MHSRACIFLILGQAFSLRNSAQKLMLSGIPSQLILVFASAPPGIWEACRYGANCPWSVCCRVVHSWQIAETGELPIAKNACGSVGSCLPRSDLMRRFAKRRPSLPLLRRNFCIWQGHPRKCCVGQYWDRGDCARFIECAVWGEWGNLLLRPLFYVE